MEKNGEYPKTIKGYDIMRNIGKGAYGNVNNHVNLHRSGKQKC
jgi:hypothetical protein